MVAVYMDHLRFKDYFISLLKEKVLCFENGFK